MEPTHWRSALVLISCGPPESLAADRSTYRFRKHHTFPIRFTGLLAVSRFSSASVEQRCEEVRGDDAENEAQSVDQQRQWKRPASGSGFSPSAELKETKAISFPRLRDSFTSINIQISDSSCNRHHQLIDRLLRLTPSSPVASVKIIMEHRRMPDLIRRRRSWLES